MGVCSADVVVWSHREEVKKTTITKASTKVSEMYMPLFGKEKRRVGPFSAIVFKKSPSILAHGLTQEPHSSENSA